MKRLLLVTHVFPPAPSPGALRPGYLARYLPQFGWDVTVLTNTVERPPFPARVISTGTSGTGMHDRIRQRIATHVLETDSPVRRLLRAVKESVLFPDTTATSLPATLKAGYSLIERENFDAILSTALPASVHVAAWLLARQSGLRWIADYRDPWAGNAYIRRGPVRTILERLLERGMLHRANAITTISEPIAQQLRAFHRRNDVHVIANSFDSADWDTIPSLHPERFDLCFTGSMYDGKRSPDVLFEALAQLRENREPVGTDARVHFYGPSSENVAASAARYGLTLVVRQHGSVSRSHAMRAQRSAAALLIFLNMDPATVNEMGSKYLEYVGARRPLIAIGPSGSVMRPFIEDHQMGWFASNVTEVMEALRAAHSRYTSGNYEMAAETRGLPTARDLAASFAAVLDATSSRVDLDQLRKAL